MSEKIHKIIVLIPFRNVRPFIVDCLNSVFAQLYPNYEVYLLDDASDDGTLQEIDQAFSNVHIIINERRLWAMENIYRPLKNLPFDDEDIIVVLDGDDALFGEYAFQMINATYNDEKVLVTYGQYITNYGMPGNFAPYTEAEFKNIRNARWKAPHLRTFKYKLFREFMIIDPMAKSLKYDDGSFFKSATDMALMFSLFEIAGYERTFCFPNVLYCYRLHAGNTHANEPGKHIQLEAEYCVRNRQLLPIV